MEHGKCGMIALAPSRREAAELFVEVELSLSTAEAPLACAGIS
jgi:hypothetical protein